MPYDQFVREHSDRDRRSREPSAGRLVPRSHLLHAANGRHGPVVPGHAAGLCQVPSSSVRTLEPAGLLRLRGVLYAGRTARTARSTSRRTCPMWSTSKATSPQSQNPRTNQSVKPTGLGGEPLDIPAWQDARHDLVDWMAAPDNPYFAKALVNRYWKHFFGRGIVDPEDDLRVTNPPSNPELLDALGEAFHRAQVRSERSRPHDLQIERLPTRAPSRRSTTRAIRKASRGFIPAG